MGSDRRAKYLPDTLAAKYTDAVNDPELLALRDDLGLIEIRLSQLLSKIETGDPQGKWIEFTTLIENSVNALKDGNIGEALLNVNLLSKRAEEKREDYQVWREIGEMIENRRRVTESESNRLIRMQQMIAAEDAVKLVDRLLDAVKRHVKEPSVYSAIAFEFAVATGAAHNGHLDGRDEEVQPDEQGRVDQTKLLGPRTQRSNSTR